MRVHVYAEASPQELLAISDEEKNSCVHDEVQTHNLRIYSAIHAVLMVLGICVRQDGVSSFGNASR